MNMTQKRSAFSMIEILVVVFIIGLLATLIGPNVAKLMFKGQTSATQSTLTALKAALADYKMDVGRFPDSLTSLVKSPGTPKWRGPYLEGQTDVPTDGWEYDFVYNRPPQQYKDRYKYYEIISYGEEGEGSPKEQWLHTGA